MVRQSGGTAIAVSEEETRKATIDLARSEGLLVEPGAAVAVAAYRKLAAQEVIRDGGDGGDRPHGTRFEGSRRPAMPQPGAKPKRRSWKPATSKRSERRWRCTI